MHHIPRPPTQIRSLGSALGTASRMVETITSTTAGDPGTTKPRSVSSASQSLLRKEGNWMVRKVVSFSEEWEYTSKDFRRGDESSVPISPPLHLVPRVISYFPWRLFVLCLGLWVVRLCTGTDGRIRSFINRHGL